MSILPIQNRVDYQSSLSNKFFDYLSSGLPILTNLNGVLKDTILQNNVAFIIQITMNFITILRCYV